MSSSRHGHDARARAGWVRRWCSSAPPIRAVRARRTAGRAATGRLARSGRRPRPFRAATHEIENYYRAADLVVMPSLREGLPNVLLEAMACGLPVVASRLPGSTDMVITDGVNGRLVRARSTSLGLPKRSARCCGDPAARGTDGRGRSAHRGRALSHRRVAEHVARRPTTRVTQPPGRCAMTHRHDIICISSIDWDFIWQGHQEIMSRARGRGAPRAVHREHRRAPAAHQRPAARAPAACATGGAAPRASAKSGPTCSSTRRSCCRCRTRGSRSGSTAHADARHATAGCAPSGFARPVVWTFLPTPLARDADRGSSIRR